MSTRKSSYDRQFEKRVIQIRLNEEVGCKKSCIRPYWSQGDFYFGDEKRLATVTDVKFISPDLLVVAHRAAAKLYLIRLFDGSYKVIHTKTLRARLLPSHDRFFHPDLISLQGRLIYMSEYSRRYAVYEIWNEKFQLRKISGAYKNNYHGCHVDGSTLLLGTTHGGTIDIVNIKTNAINQIHIVPSIQPLDDRHVRIKTIGREGDCFILGLDRRSEINAGADSWIGLFEQIGQQLHCISLLKFENTQLDGYARFQKSHFFSLHDGNIKRGTIRVLKVENSELKVSHVAKCHSFPHGLDVCGGRMAYTSYRESSAFVCEMKYLLSHDDIV